jgi:hypothetical protein
LPTPAPLAPPPPPSLQVEHIETQTEVAHQRAQQGLVQVQQAHHYQPGCAIA